MHHDTDYIDRSQTGFLFILERIARSHPLIYIFSRFLAKKLNIFEKEFDGLSKIVFKNKANLLDVGASDGVSINFFNSKLNLGRVIAVEPTKDYANKLKKINIKNLKIFNFGLSNKNETKEVYVPEYNFLSYKIKLIPYIYYDKFHLEKVIKKNFFLCKSLKIVKIYLKLKKNINIKTRIDIIKLDVNGYEFEIIKSLHGIIKKDKPIIFVEELKKIYVINSYLKTLGYTCKFYNVKSKNIELFNFKKKKDVPLTFYFIPDKNNRFLIK